jgi:hypothetical protein
MLVSLASVRLLYAAKPHEEAPLAPQIYQHASTFLRNPLVVLTLTCCRAATPASLRNSHGCFLRSWQEDDTQRVSSCIVMSSFNGCNQTLANTPSITVLIDFLSSHTSHVLLPLAFVGCFAIPPRREHAPQIPYDALSKPSNTSFIHVQILCSAASFRASPVMRLPLASLAPARLPYGSKERGCVS